MDLSKRLGLAREALFYSQLAHHLPKDALPDIYYARGDYDTGSKFILMQDLKDGIDSGCLFGPGNPNNWNKDLQAIAFHKGNSHETPLSTSYQVALLTFREMARRSMQPLWTRMASE